MSAQDWTEKNGASNSSDEFERLVIVVTGLIKGSAHDLLSGRADIVAGLILAQLAHGYGFGPLKLGDADRRELEELRAHECAAWCSRCGAPHTGAPCP